MNARLREIVARETGIEIGRIGEETDLWQAGMTSKGAVRVMLEVEDEFGIEFPPDGLTHAGFASLASIAAMVGEAAPQRREGMAPA